MSTSNESTIPNTPEELVEDALEANVFAVLWPINHPARVAFDGVVNATIKHPDEYLQCRRFLHIQRRSRRSTSVFTENEAEEHISGSESSEALWPGAYTFSLNVLPRNPAQGWLGGTGRSSSGTGAADLLLAPSSPRWKKLGIAGRHIVFSVHKESCRMVFEARHAVVVARSGARMITQSQSQVLEHREILSIGTCLYSFEYTEYFHTATFAEQLTGYMRQLGAASWSPHRHLSPASVGPSMPLGNYHCSPFAFNQGTFGTVAAGWTNQGAAVAIKHFKRPREPKFRGHEQLMDLIGHHDCILKLLQSVGHFHVPIPQAYCVYSPLALMDLSDLITNFSSNAVATMMLLANYASGLAHLHGKNVMHRDITLKNLAVQSLTPPRGIIIDLDAAIVATTSNDHTQGTFYSLAPEIVALKNENSPNPSSPSYNHSVDIWSLGLCTYALHFGTQIHWKPWAVRCGLDSSYWLTVSEPVYNLFRGSIERRREVLETELEESVLDLIEEMTEWFGSNRITAQSLSAKVTDQLQNAGPGSIEFTQGQKRDRST